MTTTVGELARRTGLTTRTLHHYEALGLLRPAQRSPAGYRLYDEASVARLHAVLAYRYLGLPLKEIAALLADDPPPLRELLRRQASLVEERIAQHERLLEALGRCTHALASGSAELDEQLLGVITATRLCEESLSADEHRLIARTRASLDDDDVRALQSEMAELMQALDAHRERDDDPGCEAVLALTRRMIELRKRVAGDDPVFHAKIRAIAARSPGLMRAQGVSTELAAYARRAREAVEHTKAPAGGGAAAPNPKKPRASKRQTGSQT